jgi:hypothetical protein
MFSHDKDKLRAFYAQSWARFEAGQPMEPLQAMVAGVVAEHPEYRAMVTSAEARAQSYTVEEGKTNPFLHMGLHVALREQAAADRPAGIAALYRQIQAAAGDQHEAEHRMMDCLGEAMWQAQRAGQPPDEQAFLECLRRLAPLARR